tara:strand:- start:239 stop:430 length:192 start_codon:yes stop_codon:yes gene_type:complete
MSAIDGLTIILVAVIIFMYVNFKGKIEELKKDIVSWRQGYSEIHTNLVKAEKIIMKLEKKNGQ